MSPPRDSAPPGNPEAETTRRRLLAAAERAVWQLGPDRMAMADVASVAGMSRPTVYRHFGSKAALLDELAREEARRFDEGLTEAARTTGSESERLGRALAFVAEYQARMNRSVVDTEPRFVLERLGEVLPMLAGSVQDLLESCGQSLVPPSDSAVVADLIVRTAISFFLFPRSSPGGLARELRHLVGLPD